MCLCIYLFLSEVQRAPRGWVQKDYGDSLRQLVLHLFSHISSFPSSLSHPRTGIIGGLVTRNPYLPFPHTFHWDKV